MIPLIGPEKNGQGSILEGEPQHDEKKTSAARDHPILKAFYRRLLAAGKSKKLAITAVMRKLVVLLNRLLKILILS